MSSQLAGLTVKIGADLTDLNKGLSDAGKNVNELGGKVSSAGDKLSGNLTAPLRDATRAAGEHHLALGRVNLALEGLASEALGTSSKIGSLATHFAEFGAGGPLVAGALAGIALIAGAWEKLTEKTRDAEKANADAIKTLEDIRKKRLAGPGGEAKLATDQTRDVGLPLARLKLKQLEDAAGSADPMSPRGLILARQIAEQKSAIDVMVRDIREGSDEVTKKVNEDAEERSKKAQEAIDKEKSAWDKFFAGLTKQKQAQRDLDDITSTLIEKKFGVDKNPPAISTVASVGLAQGAALDSIAGLKIPESVFANVLAVHTRAADKIHEAGVRLEVSADELHKAALKNLAVSAVTGLLQEHGGSLGGIAAAAIAGASGGGGVAGALIGGGAALIGTLLNHRKSVDANTSALNHLSQVMGEPAGFKVDAYRYRAQKAFEADFLQRGGVAFANG